MGEAKRKALEESPVRPASSIDVTEAMVEAADKAGCSSASEESQGASAPWLLLRIYADALDDAESNRIANENRLRSLEQVYGLIDTPETQRLEKMIDLLREVEKQASKTLENHMKLIPGIGEYVQNTTGLGLRQVGRLLAATGHPCIRVNLDGTQTKRSVSQLWSYCGYAPGQKRRKGVQSNWNADAKTRAYMIACSCVRVQHSAYRDVYDEAKAKWEDRDTIPGHKHNHALRIVSKRVLRDLWRAGQSEGDARSLATP